MVTKKKQNRLKKKTQIYYETGYSVAVCDRHNLELKMPSIFGEKVDDVLDFVGMEDTAERFITEHKEVQKKALFLYVTGLTAGVIAILNVCRRHGIPVILYHYNKEYKNYEPQRVL